MEEPGESPNIINISLGKSQNNYEGKGSSFTKGLGNTIDQSVFQTLKRDFTNIYLKILSVFRAKPSDNSLQELRRNWDLWGPLLISLTIASLVTLASHSNTEQIFTNLFVVLWLGPLIISINSRLLGANIAILPSLCLVMYSTAPVAILSLLLLLIQLFYRSFLLNLLISAIAVAMTLRATRIYFESSVPENKRYLVLYPVGLFYLFLGVYISMA